MRFDFVMTHCATTGLWSLMPIQRATLNVSLTPALERFIAERVASGRYQTASEVVRAGLRLLEQTEAHAGAPTVSPRSMNKVEGA